MAASTDQILARLDRMERRQDEMHSEVCARLRSLEETRSQMTGAKRVVTWLFSAGALGGLGTWVADLFRHGGK